MLASSRWFPTRLTQPTTPRGNWSFVPGQMYKSEPKRPQLRGELTHRFAEMTPEKRPQDPHMDDCPALRNIGPPAGNIPTQCPKTSTDQCRRPLLHLRADHAGRQADREPRIYARCGGRPAWEDSRDTSHQKQTSSLTRF